MPKKSAKKRSAKGCDEPLFAFDAPSGQPSGPSAGNTPNQRPKRHPKAIQRFDQQNFPKTRNGTASSATKVGHGFDCPRCEAVCSYDARECDACGLSCYYEAGIGVVTLKDRHSTPKRKTDRTPKKKGGAKGKSQMRSPVREEVALSDSDGEENKPAARGGDETEEEDDAHSSDASLEECVARSPAREAGTQTDVARLDGEEKPAARVAGEGEDEDNARSNDTSLEEDGKRAHMSTGGVDVDDDDGEETASFGQIQDVLNGILDPIDEADEYAPTEPNNTFVAIDGAVQTGKVAPRKVPTKSADAGLLARIKELESENKSLRDAKGELEEENEALTETNIELKGDKAAMQVQIESLKERAETEAQRGAKFEAEYIRIRDAFVGYANDLRPIINKFEENGSHTFDFEE